MSDLSEFRVNYSSPRNNPHSPTSDLPHSRSYNRHNNLTINKNDHSYQDLKSEYSKVLTYVDSVRNDRSYCKSPVESHLDRKGYSGLLSSPSASGVISPNRMSGKIQATYNRSSDSEKKMIELEQEVSELKKFLDSSNARVTALQQENRTLQEKLQNFKDVDHCNKQLGYEIKALDSEIISVTKRMKEVELENSKLLAERRNPDDPTSKEAMKNLSKYGNYILYLLGTQEPEHFSKFCFEERFNTQRDLLRLIEDKEKDQLLIQSFRYIADLLLNISSTAKNSSTSHIISPRSKGQAYLVDLSQTYNAVPIARALTPNPQSIRKDSFTPTEPNRNQRKSFQGSVSENRHLRTEGNDDCRPNHYAREYDTYSNSNSASNKRGSLNVEVFSEDRKLSTSTNKYSPQEFEYNDRAERPPLSRDSRHYQERSRKNSEISNKPTAERERLYCQPDPNRFNKSAEPTHSHARTTGGPNKESSFIRDERKYSDNDLRRTSEEEEEESFRPHHNKKSTEYRRESAQLHNTRIESELNYSSVKSPLRQERQNSGGSGAGAKHHSFGSGSEKRADYQEKESVRTISRTDSGYAEKVLKQNVGSEILRDIKRQDQSKYYEDGPSKRSSHDRFISKDIRYNESTPKLRTECDEVTSFTNHYDKDSARRIVTEDAPSNYYDDIPHLSKHSSKNSRQPNSGKSNQSSHHHQQQRKTPVPNYNDDSELSQSRDYDTEEQHPQYINRQGSQNLSKKASPTYKSQKSDVSSHTSPKDSRKPSSNLLIPKGSQVLKKSTTTPKNNGQSRSPSAVSYASNDYESLSEAPQYYQEQPRSKSKSRSNQKQQQKHINDDSELDQEDYIESRRPVPIAQKTEIIYDELRSVASGQSTSKRPSNSGHISPQSKIASVQDRIPAAKSPSTTKSANSNKPIVPVLKAKGKDKAAPSISTSQPMQNNSSTAVKMTSPTNNTVSQIVYAKKKSANNLMSSVQSAKSIGTVSSKNRSDNDDSDTPVAKDKDLVKREQELIQRIRELKEKEKEIMEKEKEINSKGKELRKQMSAQEQDQTPQSTKSSRYVNIKESYASVKSPKHDLKASKQQSQKSQSKHQSDYRDDESEQNIDEEEEEDYSNEQREYPTKDRQEMYPQNELDSSRLKSILKKTNSMQDSSPLLKKKESYLKNSKEYNSTETLGYSSAFRSSQGGDKREMDEFIEYETNHSQTRGRKGVTVSSPDEHSPDMYRSSKNGSILAAVESNHHKRLTFGTESNFEQEFPGELYSAERNESPPPGSRGSPSKSRISAAESKDQGTNYPSFIVSFGKTESKFKRSQSPTSSIPGILDVPRKKKVEHNAQTYDVIKGKEIKNRDAKVPELEILPTPSWQIERSQATISDISEINRGQLTNDERIVFQSPEKGRGTAIDE